MEPLGGSGLDQCSLGLEGGGGVQGTVGEKGA